MQTRVELAGFAMLCVLLAAVIVQGAEHCHKDGGCEVENKKAEEPLRLIMVGKTGSGKSATGNTILGEKKFKVARMSKSVTQKAQLERTVIDGRTVEVMESTRLLDATFSNLNISMEIIRALGSLRPGLHAVLFVIDAVYFTDEDYTTYERLKKIFEKVTDHIVVVFTHLDELTEQGTSTDDFILKLDKKLQTVLEECKWRHVFFDNKSGNISQAVPLINTIKELGVTPYAVQGQFLSFVEQVLKDMTARVNLELAQKGKDKRSGDSFEDRQELSAGLLDRFVDIKGQPFRAIWGYSKWLFDEQ